MTEGNWQEATSMGIPTMTKTGANFYLFSEQSLCKLIFHLLFWSLSKLIFHFLVAIKIDFSFYFLVTIEIDFSFSGRYGNWFFIFWSPWQLIFHFLDYRHWWSQLSCLINRWPSTPWSPQTKARSKPQPTWFHWGWLWLSRCLWWWRKQWPSTAWSPEPKPDPSPNRPGFTGL